MTKIDWLRQMRENRFEARAIKKKPAAKPARPLGKVDGAGKSGTLRERLRARRNDAPRV
jgi:hypothetical protein